MIALDTNILIRYLICDDLVQSRVAEELIGTLSTERKGYICREVLLELVWVLERTYRRSRADISTMLGVLLASKELTFEAEIELEPLINLYLEEGFGFADLMIVAASRRAGVREVVTFDRKFARLSEVKLLSDSGSYNAH